VAPLRGSEARIAAVSLDRYEDALAVMLGSSVAAICVHEDVASKVHCGSTLLLSDLKARSGSDPPTSLRIFGTDDEGAKDARGNPFRLGK
jgi:hypothetical protein